MPWEKKVGNTRGGSEGGTYWEVLRPMSIQSISERVNNMKSPVVCSLNWVAFAVGFLLAHFAFWPVW